MAEMICDARLGPAKTQCNWVLIAIDAKRYRKPSTMMQAAEEVLQKLRLCPPAPGFDAVEVRGGREPAMKKTKSIFWSCITCKNFSRLKKLAKELRIN